MHFRISQLFFGALILHFSRVTATNSSGYSTFIYPASKGNLTYALTAARNGDVYMHLAAPADYSWVGVGTGKTMDGSVMWILYQGKGKDAMTLSPRLSHGNVEPSYSKRINCILMDGAHFSTVDNTKYYTADIRCSNLTSIGENQGKLSMDEKKQDFIYAFGPAGSVGSDSKSAGIQRHDSYGNFWMDMTTAQVANDGAASVPSGNALMAMSNAGADGKAQSDGDKIAPAHGAFMLATFVIVFPLGAVLLRWMESVRAHWVTQSIGVIFSIIGLGLGIYESTIYNDSNNFATGHQIFGFIIAALVFGQWSGGLFHHLQYRKYNKSTIVGKIHRVLGAIVVICGIINGFLGFNLASNDDDNVWYGIVMGVIIAIVIILLGWKRWSNRKKQKADISPADRAFDHSEYRMNLIKRLHNRSESHST